MLSTKPENYKDRYNIKIAHGFRKFFNTALSSIRTKDGRLAIDFIRKEMMMGHALMNIYALEENYNRADRPKMLLKDYLKAVSEPLFFNVLCMDITDQATTANC